MSKKENKLIQLVDAVIHNDPDTVNQLLNSGLNPNQCLDKAGITPLHYAAQNDSILVIPLLVEAGADIHALTESEGLSPLEVAVMHGNNKVAQVLLAYTLDSDQQSH